MAAPDPYPRRRASDPDALAVALGMLRRFLLDDPFGRQLHPELAVRAVYREALAAAYAEVDALSLIEHAIALHDRVEPARVRAAREALTTLAAGEVRR